MYTKISKSNDLRKLKFVTVDIVHNIWGYGTLKLEWYDYFSNISHRKYSTKQELKCSLLSIAQLLDYWNY